MALEMATTLLEPVVNYIIKPIGRQLGYLISYRTNIDELKAEMENLKKLRDDVEQSKKEADRNLEKVGDVVTNWLEKTDEILKDTNTILPSEADVAKGCLSQGLRSRYVLSKRAKLMTNIVTQQKNDGNKYERFSHPASPVVACIITKRDADDDGLSRTKILADIIKALNDQEINGIGICGPGGVGKTRMEKKVIAKVKEGNLFDLVVYATFGRQFKLEEVQGSIAEQLGLELHERDTNIRAKRLNERLKKENKILLILDDVWENLDLEEIGIPPVEEHQGCKVMLSSRRTDVCSSMLPTTRGIFTIKALSKEEAWDLFRRNVGAIVDDPDWNQTAQSIAEECGGLPLAILAIANALKDKDRETWEETLSQLKLPIPKDIQEFGKVYASLMLTYDLLDSEEAKKLYLHCCLFPEDSNISLEDLATRGMSLGMFRGVNRLHEARRRVKFLVDKLKICFLLLEGEDDDEVIMHDVFRDLAIYITSGEHRFVISHDLSLKQWPVDVHEDVICISVQSNLIQKHPKTLSCPRLELLELKTTETCDSLPDDIFQETITLKVIEISNMQFSLLPSSIGLLKNLRMLRLIDCKMENISLIGELINLEILSLRGSRFHVFPAKLGSLEKLRLLDLNSCKCAKGIEPNTLSRFVELEELDLTDCYKVEWETANEGEQRRNVSLAELEAMQNLTTLRIRISDRAIPKYTTLPSGLTEYCICITSSNGYYEHLDSQYSKTIWCECDVEHGVNWIRNIVPGAERLLLRKTVAKHVIDLLASSESTYQNVKCFEVSYCDELLYFANTSDFINPWKASSQYNCFSNLKRIRIDFCHKLEHVFLLEDENKVSFPRLEEIELTNLKELKGFCNGTHNIELPSLSSLYLKELPNIKGFFDSFSTESNPSEKQNFLFRTKDALGSLKHLTLYRIDNTMLFCNQLSHPCFRKLDSLSIYICKNVPLCLFTDVVSDDALSVKEEEEQEERVIVNSLFPHLKELTLIEVPELRCVVSLNMQKVPFPNLKDLSVFDCHRLRHFSSLSVARTSLQQVETITFICCDEMDQVFVLEEDEPRASNQSQMRDILFPKLLNLKLIGLPLLTSFCKGINNIDFPNLRILSIRSLNNIKGFVTQDAQQSNDIGFLFGSKVEEEQEERVIVNSLFPQLKDLTLKELPELRCVVSLNMQIVAFPNLKELTVNVCKRLLHFSSLSVASTCLQQVESITFTHCDEMDQVFVLEEDEPRASNQSDIRFPMLRKLELQYLPALTSFCKGINSIDFPNLSNLIVAGLNNIKGFVTEDAEPSNDIGFLFGSKVSFGRLESLYLESLDSELWFHQLSNTYFRQLQRLKIKDCSQIEVVIEEDEQEEVMSKKTLFPKLYSLRLENLSKLGSFSQRKHALHFPSLEEVKIHNCSEMQTFAQGYISTPKLHKLIINWSVYPVNDINNSIRQHFDEKQHANKEEITSEEEVDEETEITEEVTEE